MKLPNLVLVCKFDTMEFDLDCGNKQFTTENDGFIMVTKHSVMTCLLWRKS